MTEPKIVSIDITHLVVAALHREAGSATPPLTKPPLRPPTPPAGRPDDGG